MPGPYAYMTDDELTQELADYRAASKKFAMGGNLKVIAGEGRRKEFAAGDMTTFNANFRELVAEYNRRPSLSGPGCGGGGSLGIDFGRVGGGGYDYGSVVVTDV
jgi:hypothetical protein